MCVYGGRDSSVGIATRYGPDGPGIESRWRHERSSVAFVVYVVASATSRSLAQRSLTLCECLCLIACDLRLRSSNMGCWAAERKKCYIPFNGDEVMTGLVTAGAGTAFLNSLW